MVCIGSCLYAILFELTSCWSLRCLLTPGPFSETYFEQAHLARYLGFLLVEGDDLVVRDGQVYVRTIAGLKRADVLWRRGAFAVLSATVQ